MGLVKTPAVVLGSRNLGEADKLVTLFTPQHGKLTGVAKGARRIRSRFGSSLEPFTYGQAILFQKTREVLYRIQQLDILRSFQELREDLDLITMASRMTSLTYAMAPDGEPNPALFGVLVESFAALKEKDGDLATRLYEIRLLQYAGFQPRLEMNGCLRCHRTLDSPEIFFSPASGGIICKGCRGRERILSPPVTRGTVAFFRQALKFSPRLAFRLKATTAVRQELKTLLEIYFDHLLDRSA